MKGATKGAVLFNSINHEGAQMHRTVQGCGEDAGWWGERPLVPSEERVGHEEEGEGPPTPTPQHTVSGSVVLLCFLLR